VAEAAAAPPAFVMAPQLGAAGPLLLGGTLGAEALGACAAPPDPPAPGNGDGLDEGHGACCAGGADGEEPNGAEYDDGRSGAEGAEYDD
jgi:hypothetical protein